MAGVWDSSTLEQHAVWMMERLLLALTDSDEDDSSVREELLFLFLLVYFISLTGSDEDASSVREKGILKRSHGCGDIYETS